MFSTSKRLSLCCLLLLPLAAHAQSNAPDVQKVLSQLNAAAAKFQSAQANFDWDQLTLAVQDHDIQTGTIYFERKKGEKTTLMAADLKQHNGQNAPRTMVYDGGQLQYYEPNIKQLTLIEAGKNQSQWESFLTLGFGGSGTDLEANWKVSVQGTDTMNGVFVVKLDLVPLQEKVLKMFTHVTIWVDPTRSVSYKQIFYQSTGDTRTAVYKDIRYNMPIPASTFKIQTATGTNTVRRQP
jgi:outer membrane lipoprotein-sorting protein